jgi:hypothetical protein
VALASRLGGDDSFEFVVFADGLVLWEGPCSHEPSSLHRGQLSSTGMSRLRSFLSQLTPSSDPAPDCTHAPVTELFWMAGDKRQSQVDRCDGRFGGHAKESVAQVRKLLDLEHPPSPRCPPGDTVETSLIWQLTHYQ